MPLCEHHLEQKDMPLFGSDVAMDGSVASREAEAWRRLARPRAINPAMKSSRVWNIKQEEQLQEIGHAERMKDTGAS
jgi:hypothetical protein